MMQIWSMVLNHFPFTEGTENLATSSFWHKALAKLIQQGSYPQRKRHFRTRQLRLMECQIQDGGLSDTDAATPLQKSVYHDSKGKIITPRTRFRVRIIR